MMASPPFSLTTSSPGDTDIASVFPALDRSDKDVIQSWLLSVLNVYGRMTQAPMDGVGTTYGLVSNPTPAAGTSTIFRGSAGVIEVIDGETSTIQTLGVPPGTVLDYAGGSLPNGYLLCSGQAVSRSTYANLFSVISTVWGVGDGSSTFNLPDLRGRATFGLDNMGGTAAGRITSANTIDGTVFGNTGGLQASAISTAQLPVTNPTITITDAGHSHGFAVTQSGTASGSLTNSYFYTGEEGYTPLVGTQYMAGGANGPGVITKNTTGITATTTFGSGTIFPTLPPAAIVNKIIKF